MRMSRARICWTLVITSMLVLLVSGIFVAKFSQSSLPLILSRNFISQVEKEAQVRLQLGEVRWVTPWHLVLYNVTITPKNEQTGFVSLAGPMYIPKIVLHLNLPALLWGNRTAAISSVDVMAPRGTLLLGAENQSEQNGQPTSYPKRPSLANIEITFPQLRFTLREGSLILVDATGEHAIWQHITAKGYTSTDKWHLTLLRAKNNQGEVVIKGDGTGKGLNLSVNARNLELPAAIPVVNTWGISGQSTFTGNVTGTVANPQLSGWLTLRHGTLWEQAVDNACGQVMITNQETIFKEVVIKKDQAIYRLAGLVNRAGGNPSLNIDLHSTRGRAEQLLAVLNITLPAEGEIDGDIAFAGPLGKIMVSGNIGMRQVSIFDASLDGLQGKFRWENDRLHFDHTKVYLKAGSLVLNGWLSVESKDMDLDIHVSNWSLEEIPHLPAAFNNWRGVLSGSGHLNGSLAEPVFQGDVAAQNIKRGSLVLTEAKGPISLVNDVVSSTGLVATTVEGGTWWLQGEVAGVSSAPQLELNMKVEDEPFSSLLRMSGYSLPITLVDGLVAGNVQTKGQLGSLRTQLQLSLAQVENFGEALQLDILISGRKIKRLNLS